MIFFSTSKGQICDVFLTQFTTFGTQYGIQIDQNIWFYKFQLNTSCKEGEERLDMLCFDREGNDNIEVYSKV